MISSLLKQPFKVLQDNQKLTTRHEWESRHYSSFLGYLFYIRLCYAVTKTFIYLGEEPDT